MGSEDSKSKNSHSPVHVVLLVLSLIGLLAVVVITYLNATTMGQDAGIFQNSTVNASDIYYSEITPAFWTFLLWWVIYFWHLVWMIYAFVGLCRKSPQGGPLYTHPELLTPPFYVLFLLNMGSSVAWLVVFDRGYIDWALIPIFALPITLYGCLAIVHVRLNRHGNYMQKSRFLRKDIWLTRFLVQNGLATSATWSTIACWLALGTVLTNRLGLDQSLSATISLSILTVQLTAWFILDLFVLDRYTRYSFMPYVVVCFALAGSLINNFDLTKNNAVATIALLAVGSLALVIKVFMMFYRHCTRPIFTSSEGEEYTMEMRATQPE